MTPAENQQTVEALARVAEQGMSRNVVAPDGTTCLNTNYKDARAALRELAAQAEAAERRAERAEAALQRAADYCARPPGVCLPAVPADSREPA